MRVLTSIGLNHSSSDEMSWFLIVAGLLMFTIATPSSAYYFQHSCNNTAPGLKRHLCLRRFLVERPAVATRASTCPAGCAVHGVCNEEVGRCDCPRNFKGPSCSNAVTNFAENCLRYSLSLRDCRKDAPCFNNCHRKGKCIAGMCHCEKGYWGVDCSISWGPNRKPQLLDGNYQARKTGVKIYVYELPSNLTSWYPFLRLDRPLHVLFWQRLMSAGVRTLDGDKADYYFIPVNTRGALAMDQMKWALEHIRTTYPWWAKDNGHRHLVIHTGDMGIVDFPLTMRRMYNESMYNMTWLHHWGLTETRETGPWEIAHRPGKDIVVPVLIATQGFHQSPMNPKVAADAMATGGLPIRNGTLFFAGRICGDRDLPSASTGKCGTYHFDYSFGVRQAVYLFHRKTKGFKIVPWTESYLEDISTYKFCLAPVGGGHGKRQILVSLMGCIPVLIGDNVLQPFEPEMDWSKFSVSLPESDIPNLPEILTKIPAAEIAAKQKRLFCAAQHMYYSSSLGAILGEDGRYDAFESLLEILRMRKEHPNTPPEKYTRVDERYRKFINCELDDPEPVPLCTQGEDEQIPGRQPCVDCRRKDAGGFFSTAGGMLCCADPDINNCPRVWE